MRAYIGFEALLFFKDRKNVFLFIGIAIFLLGLLFYIPYQRVNDISDETQAELNLVRGAIAQFPLHVIEEDPDAFPVYETVLKESQLIARKELALTMSNDLDAFVENGLGLANNRIEAAEIGYGSVQEAAFVPLEQSLRDRVFYSALIDQELTIERDAATSSSYLVMGISLFGQAFFVFLMLLACDVLSKDDDHRSLLGAFPLDQSKKLLAKLAVYFLVTILILLLLFGGAYLLSFFWFDSGSIEYPRVIYDGSYQAISTLSFLGLALLMVSIYTVHTILLAALLNRCLNNRYLTFFAGVSLLLLGVLLPSFSLLSFTPIPLLDPISVLLGDAAIRYNLSAVTYLRSIIVYLVWIGFYGAVLSASFSTHFKALISNRRKEAN